MLGLWWGLEHVRSSECSLEMTILISALLSVARVYISGATFMSERTTHMALFSLAQTLGFIMGPGIQVSKMNKMCP